MRELSPKSTDYLRPDIEYNQLSNETAVPLVVANAGYTLESRAAGGANCAVRTTGNGIIYLNGRLEMTSAGATGGDKLVTFPTRFGPFQGTAHFNIQRDSSGTFSAFPIKVVKGASESWVEALDTLLIGDFVFLNPIIYFKDS